MRKGERVQMDRQKRGADMNFRQKSSRYSGAVLFTAGIAGAILVVASISSGFRPEIEIWLATALVVSIILHARAGFALSRAQQELEMLRGLVDKFQPTRRKAQPDVAFEPASDVSENDADVLKEVQNAIENDRIDLYLQPIVSLPQRKLRYYEAFSRLRKADGDVLRPADYIDAAERANRIGVIDNMILLRAVQALRQFDPMNSQHRIFCNLSPATIFDNDFFTRFTDYLDANEDLAHRLVFEFTYPAVEMMHDRVRTNLEAIAKRGYAFSVDHIRRFDLDWAALRAKNFRYVKASSAMLLAESSKGEEGRKRVHQFKQALFDNGIDLIVEKIEYESKMPHILELGIDYGQGTLFGVPQIATQFTAKEPVRAVA